MIEQSLYELRFRPIGPTGGVERCATIGVVGVNGEKKLVEEEQDHVEMAHVGRYGEGVDGRGRERCLGMRQE